MFPRFALCLAPLIITGIITIAFGGKIANESGPFGFLGVCILLIGIGAILSGFFVARLVARAVKEPLWWQILASVLVFVVVAVGYTVLGFFGGCMIVLASS